MAMSVAPDRFVYWGHMGNTLVGVLSSIGANEATCSLYGAMRPDLVTVTVLSWNGNRALVDRRRAALKAHGILPDYAP